MQWKLIQVGEPQANTWKLENQRDNPGRFLAPQLEDEQPNENYRLAGGIVPCDFFIEEVEERGVYRILFNVDRDSAVTLVTGKEVYKIQDRDVVCDLHADGPPIALQPVEDDNPAQIWSFLASDLAVVSPLQNGRAYKIVNSHTGTVLEVGNTVGKPVHGLVSRGGSNHTWTVLGNTDNYTFKSSTIPNHFLVPDVAQGDLPGHGTALIGGLEDQATRFTVRNVPGTRLYKIFLDSLLPTTKSRGLAVNLATVDGAPDSLDGAVVSLQATEAQGWYFVEVT
ncbi:hypothetical protein M413DRAFT_32780 [Hebeloma cylindrosporum]|uniref:Ricin B lectin domain-containing protein n=1 Tax=Hebeloma cylindrosporum TaxID=76867 RepID=A0A0C3BUM4_HEBCY|nr:hypothetical protein M413DRAFT_32780 [Hebeloma cylindrosporum h7]